MANYQKRWHPTPKVECHIGITVEKYDYLFLSIRFKTSGLSVVM